MGYLEGQGLEVVVSNYTYLKEQCGFQLDPCGQDMQKRKALWLFLRGWPRLTYVLTFLSNDECRFGYCCKNMTFRRKVYGYNKGLDKAVSNEGKLWVGYNIVFPMTWLGSQVVKKVTLSLRAWQLGSTKVCQEVLTHARQSQGMIGMPRQAKF